jgi:hypothetical protein
MKKMIMSLGVLLMIGTASPLLAQEEAKSGTASPGETPGGVKGLEKRVKHLEQAVLREVEGERWYDRLQFSGLVEVEAANEKIDYNDPATPDEKGSDIDLATVELDFDARIVDHVDAHVMIKYEEDELFIDEGFITLIGTETFPAYLIAGRQYIPFGYFDSFFVTDPTTLELGETNEGAVVAGYRFGDNMVDVSLGAFNGRAQEAGEDDTINSFVANIAVTPFEELMFGASYTSNLANSDSFNDSIIDPDNLASLVAGWGAYGTYKLMERLTLIGEYVGALDNFAAGEVYDPADAKQRKPTAWNIELGFGVTEAVEVAARFGGSNDGGDFLPESEYGAVLNWGIFDSTNLAFEYLHGKFEDNLQETDVATIQLAVEF